eukprot:3627982-Rhodomonas_salina.1
MAAVPSRTAQGTQGAQGGTGRDRRQENELTLVALLLWVSVLVWSRSWSQNDLDAATTEEEMTVTGTIEVMMSRGGGGGGWRGGGGYEGGGKRIFARSFPRSITVALSSEPFCFAFQPRCRDTSRWGRSAMVHCSHVLGAEESGAYLQMSCNPLRHAHGLEP